LETISASISGTDMGYLLRKNPARVHSFDLAFGKAHVFYPELSDAKSSACLLIDIDPVGLVGGRSQTAGEGRCCISFASVTFPSSMSSTNGM
jgi:hypothetical protein